MVYNYSQIVFKLFYQGVGTLNISVLGCGRWGSFIAWYLNKTGHNVILWGREGSSHLNEIKNTRKNSFLNFDKKIMVSSDIEKTLEHAEIIVISINAQSLRNFCEILRNQFKKNLIGKTFVLCMKGIEESSGKRLSEILKETFDFDINVAVWVGPGHVQDFSLGIPNCMVIDSESESTKDFLINNFSSSLIRFYYGTDMIGSEIGAAAKNVMGIAAGILDAMGYESLKGALMSRGTHEIARLIKAMGGNEISAYGLAHLGDYQATLFSQYSNNRKFGESLVKRNGYSKLAEGVSTSFAIVKLGKKYNVDLPICTAVNDAVSGKILPESAIKKLFLRRTKREF